MAARGPDLQDLMRRRIDEILLVASPYDAYILGEAGGLGELILTEFLELNLHQTPAIRSVPGGEEALRALAERPQVGLVIATPQVGDMDAVELARRVRQAGRDVPVVLLSFDNRELRQFVARHDVSPLERAFLWQGDARILPAIVKSVEDRLNLEHDTGAGVQVVLLVEDNVRYYSAFLPEVYAELLRHTGRLVSEGENAARRIVRMRARPKILLASTFEAAWETFSAHAEHVLGVISDVEYPMGGAWCDRAGVELARRVREAWPDVPVLLNSSRAENEEPAREAGASFVRKGSALLLHELRRFMVDSFGFGDFVFRTPDGEEVARATDLRSLAECLARVPADSLAHHAERNHFSRWLKARTEFALAERLRPRRVSDFPTLEDLRKELLGAIAAYRHERAAAVVTDFSRENREVVPEGFYRIGGGSLGGKARGLAFVRQQLAEGALGAPVPGVRVVVPTAVVLATDVFDRFLIRNNLRDFALESGDDAAIERRFLEATFPEEAARELSAFLEHLPGPLAVRSSSLLEDSQYQPFTGVYETFMLGNAHPSPDVRLKRLLRAVARVYASTFNRHAKSYVQATPYRLEEEKMAVIVQRLVGRPHGARDPERPDLCRFYPDSSGVARSHNFYPHSPMRASDGVAAVALGLGRAVASGQNCLRFCPRYPEALPQFSSVRDILQNSQREFYAVETDPHADEGDMREHPFDVALAEKDGTLYAVGSTYSPEDNAVHLGLSRPGYRLVSFASILKHRSFPLAELVDRCLDLGRRGMNAPVEIEFAVRLGRGKEEAEFAFLQMRPMALADESEALEVGEVDPAQVLCRSRAVLGNGRLDDLRDLVVVDYHRFDRAHSREVAEEVGHLNARLVSEGVPYLLVGVGRWGSSDPWLGIPVTWDQISGARVIVEAGLRDFRVTPSQGSHFFQNLTSFDVGYFTVNPELGEGVLDWEWLAAQPALSDNVGVRHVRLQAPVVVKIDGRRGEGVILKP